MLKAIIFDMDGVICDSEHLHMQAFQQVLTEESAPITDQEYYDKYLAHDDRGSFEAALKDKHQPAPDMQKMKGLLQRKSRYFESLIKDGLVIFPGVESFVRKVSNKHTLALATGARRLEAEYVLRKAKLRDVFAAIVTADEVKVGKPEPESFERALDLMNQVRLQGSPEILPSEVLVIEDSPRCIQTVKRLGMKAVGMASSYPAEQLREADHVIDTFVGLPLETLENLFV